MTYEFDPANVQKAAAYLTLAKQLGATDAVLFEAPQI